MNRLRQIVASLLAAATAATVVACGDLEDTIAQQSAGDAAPQIPALVDAQVLSWLVDKNAPGATVAVTVDGRLVLSKGYGVSDLESGTQMQPWHRARIGSVSKLITTILVLQMVEQGVLELDDPVYTSGAAALWGDDPDDPPGLVLTGDGVVDNPADYLQALVAGVENLSGDSSIVDPPAYLTQDSHQENVELALDWASQIRIRHLLSHTSGLLRNGNRTKSAEALGVDEDDLAYPMSHQGMLMGANGPPLLFEPGTGRSYSNHAFGFTGGIIHELTGVPYEEYAQANVFAPLGLDDVVPYGIELGPLDVTPYRSTAGDPVENPYAITGEPGSTATGGWIMTAQDLARVACSLDEVSNQQRLLDRDTVDTMATIWFPDADDNQPLGWDARNSSNELTKNGKTDQGGARVTKFLPGSVADVEINVAVVTNLGKAPGQELLRNIAEAVAGAAIPEDYDLFEKNPCYLPPDESLAVPTPGRDELPDPPSGPVVAAPSPTSPAAPERNPTPPEPTPTIAPPPQIGELTLWNEEIWTTFGDITCGPAETEVRARVQSGTELRDVQFQWAIEEGDRPDQAGSDAMLDTGSGLWSATLGPFDLWLLPEPRSVSRVVTVTVTATDAHGQHTSAETELLLHPCPEPAG